MLRIADRLRIGATICAWMESHPAVMKPPWRELTRSAFGMRPSNMFTQRLRRAYREYLVHGAGGQRTAAGAGAETRYHRRRCTDTAVPGRGDRNDWIGFELLQFFVDEIECIKCRADSRLLMTQARMLRETLVEWGTPLHRLPKISKQWMYRWRRYHGIVLRNGTTHFQVSFAKAKDRVRCMMCNIFRLRALWERCHPGIPMRWLSIDQKPSWMNNAGRRPMYARKGKREVAAKENHNATRDRYTILTYVPSWDMPDDKPPPVGLLFKSRTGERLRRELRWPAWMNLQFQEKGSYRSTDVVDALKWAIPPSTCSEESVVVLLDWFAAHLTDEVQDALRNMGHVVLYHGGGVTGLEQVNDTHLHATVQRFMEQLETAAMFEQRKRCPEKMASLTRQAVIDVVTEMWTSMNHKSVRDKGYRQTGPTLPLDCSLDDVFVDLQPYWAAIDGNALHHQAIQDVSDKWEQGILQSWHDAHLIIEQHTPHPYVAEGLEGYTWEVVDDEGDDDDDDDDDADDSNPGGGIGDKAKRGGSVHGSSLDDNLGPGPSSGPAASCLEHAPTAHAGAATQDPGHGTPPSPGALVAQHLDTRPSSDAVVAGLGRESSGDAEHGAQFGGLCTEQPYLDALQTVVHVCKCTRNDSLLRPVLRELRKSGTKRSVEATDESKELRRVARLDQMQRVAERARQRALERDEARATLDAQTRAYDAKRLACESRRAHLQAASAIRQEGMKRKEAAARAQRESVWLQTEFPVALANRLIEWRNGLDIRKADELHRAVKSLIRQDLNNQNMALPKLWTSDNTLTTVRSSIGMTKNKRSKVRCTKAFEWVLFRQKWAKEARTQDAGNAMKQLLTEIVPQAGDLFSRRFTMQIMFGDNECIAEKVFVQSIIMLSAWLGPVLFPEGIIAWPPDIPAEVTAG